MNTEEEERLIGRLLLDFDALRHDALPPPPPPPARPSSPTPTERKVPAYRAKLDFFVEFTKDFMTRNPMGCVLSSHACTGTCDLYSKNDYYACRTTGNIHICNLTDCERRIHTREGYVCELTAIAYNPPLKSTTADFFNEQLGFQVDPSFRPRGGTHSISYDDAAPTDDTSEEWTYWDTNEEPVRLKMHTDLVQRKRVLLLDAPVKRKRRRDLGDEPVHRHRRLPRPVPPPKRKKKHDLQTMQCIRSKKAMNPFTAYESAFSIVAGVLPTMASIGRESLCCEDQQHTAMVARHCVDVWCALAQTRAYQLTATNATYNFEMHCFVVLDQMTTGLTIHGLEIIPQIDCVRHHLPLRTTLAHKRPSIGTLTDASKRFKRFMYEIDRADAYILAKKVQWALPAPAYDPPPLLLAM